MIKDIYWRNNITTCSFLEGKITIENSQQKALIYGTYFQKAIKIKDDDDLSRIKVFILI